MLFFSCVLITLTTLYSGVLLWLRRGLTGPGTADNTEQPNVSIIIAARDEEKNIRRCLDAVLCQTYPKDKLEVVVIDDRSSDRTADIVREFTPLAPHLRLLRIDTSSSTLSPKKRAIDFGVRRSRGEIIVTTDADCQPGPEWIAGLVTYFEPDVGLVAGYNPYSVTTQSWGTLRRILALDYFAMACVSAATAGLGRAISCSGGNLAYRKQVYEQIGGFKQFADWVSGDDDFFLEQVRTRTEWKIRYACDPKTFVQTQPPSTFPEFVHQRIRYASKCRHYTAGIVSMLAGVYLLNLLLVLGFSLSPLNLKFGATAAVSFALKLLAEWFFVRRGQRVFREKHPRHVFALAAILHPAYIVLAGLLGQVSKFKWKKEVFSRKVRLEFSHN